MAKLNINTSIAAGATVDVLTGWNFQIPARPGKVKLNAWAPATGLFMSLTSLDRTIFQDSPVSAGAAANVLPTDFTVDPIIEQVPGGQKLSLLVRNPTGGAVVFLGTIDFMGGGKR